jgi:hypothetical protein
MKRLQVVLSDEEAKQVEEIARLNYRPVSNLLRQIINKALGNPDSYSCPNCGPLNYSEIGADVLRGLLCLKCGNSVRVVKSG